MARGTSCNAVPPSALPRHRRTSWTRWVTRRPSTIRGSSRSTSTGPPDPKNGRPEPRTTGTRLSTTWSMSPSERLTADIARCDRDVAVAGEDPGLLDGAADVGIEGERRGAEVRPVGGRVVGDHEGVLAVGKRPKLDAHTSLAAGGINAALGTMDPDDTWQQHAADTLKESYLLAHPGRCRSWPRARLVASRISNGTA